MSSHDSQKEAKKALRSEIKSRLSQLSAQDLTAQSEKAQNIILNSSQYKNARRVGIYLSMPQSEAQTDILIRDALSASSSQAKTVFVPYIYSVKNDDATSKKRTIKAMDMMRLKTIEEYTGLEKDGWGIPKLSDEGIEERENAMGWKGLSIDTDGSRVEKDDDAAEGGLDLIVVPAVAFDRKLNRLGHGAGFYDKFLTRNFGDEKRRKPYLFGLCLAEQIVPDGKLATEPWDWRVDAVAVGNGTLLTSDDIQ
ncbi:hypothetical protein CKM354_000637900 [Cercospora kikuchii]|uniref:5-formyltetrahydrofolate cyclo-ligase n=1 Tax=Cercospora kikuchii TaxID=84275 RepID=A0A9P3FI60_9PEZI|nr:5-formyltetrahydrofolate cyclo-ligase [Cercospora kikuchii]GIZ43140.1 hypothetical protein CKM354_000637900 [Cercospora kikuchii]